MALHKHFLLQSIFDHPQKCTIAKVPNCPLGVQFVPQSVTGLCLRAAGADIWAHPCPLKTKICSCHWQADSRRAVCGPVLLLCAPWVGLHRVPARCRAARSWRGFLLCSWVPQNVLTKSWAMVNREILEVHSPEWRGGVGGKWATEDKPEERTVWFPMKSQRTVSRVPAADWGRETWWLYRQNSKKKYNPPIQWQPSFGFFDSCLACPGGVSGQPSPVTTSLVSPSVSFS